MFDTDPGDLSEAASPIPGFDQPPGIEPRWSPVTAPPAASAHPRRDRGHPSTVRTAFVAALLSAALTGGASFLAFRATSPSSPELAGATSGAAATPATSSVPVTAGGSTAQAPAQTGTSSTPTGNQATSAASGASVVTIAARAIPSVVTITATTTQTGYGFFGPRSFQQTGVGSGFIFGSSGLILTNAHVVAGADTVSVQLASGRTLSGRVYGVSSTNDLAVVKVSGSNLPSLAIGASSTLNVGESVVAIGTPLGEYPDSVTTGVVSGLDRSIDVQGARLSGLIQTDAPINPGNSGGPLLDPAGRVVGIATATSSDAQGLSFAIPIDAARAVIAAAEAGRPIG